MTNLSNGKFLHTYIRFVYLDMLLYPCLKIFINHLLLVQFCASILVQANITWFFPFYIKLYLIYMSSFYLLGAFNSCIISIKMPNTHNKQGKNRPWTYQFLHFVLWNVFITIIILLKEVFEKQRFFAPQMWHRGSELSPKPNFTGLMNSGGAFSM